MRINTYKYYISLMFGYDMSLATGIAQAFQIQDTNGVGPNSRRSNSMTAEVTLQR